MRLQSDGVRYALAGDSVRVRYSLVDGNGLVLGNLQGIRVTLTLTGGAIFNGNASEGAVLSGAGTGRALVELSSGFVELEVSDPLPETVVLEGEDTEQVGVEVSVLVWEDFESGPAGFRHSGINDAWEWGTPTSGPGAASSGTTVWATRLGGSYPHDSISDLVTPTYRLKPRSRPRIYFSSWLESEAERDFGLLELSADGGATWTTLLRESGPQGYYYFPESELTSHAGEDVAFRFRFTSDESGNAAGWYIDDFVLTDTLKTIVFLDPSSDADGDGLSNAEESRRGTDPFLPDSDDDRTPDAQDNCELIPNQDQADGFHPNGIGDACDDPDGDGIPDLTDNCADTPNADQIDRLHPNGIGDACDDPDGDAIPDALDNCLDVANANQADPDGDRVGSACDICPTLYDPAQSETVACIGFIEDGGECLETEIDLLPSGVRGDLRVKEQRAGTPDSLTFEMLNAVCQSADTFEFYLNGTPLGSRPGNPAAGCSCTPTLQSFVFNDSAVLGSAWIAGGQNLLGFKKTSSHSFYGWVRVQIGSGTNRETECVNDIQGGTCDQMNLCSAGFTQNVVDASKQVAEPFIIDTPVIVRSYEDSELPGRIDISDLVPGTYRLCVTGATEDCAPVTKTTERHLAINGAPCGPPVAVAGPDLIAECASPDGAVVTLDGSGSSDPDSTDGTHDDIVRFDWYEEGNPIAAGEVVPATFSLGTHTVGLTVVDKFGSTATDDVSVIVRDTLPPSGRITSPAAGACFGPVSLPVRVSDSFSDVCDPAIGRLYDPVGGPTYDAHGDYSVMLTASDVTGNAISDGVAFTIDTKPPSVQLLAPPEHTVLSPMALPLSVVVASSDDDGATGGVVYEVVKLDGCLIYDGWSYGDQDGLLSDEAIALTRAELCRISVLCGFTELERPELRVEATDCGGNVGSDGHRLAGDIRLRPGPCGP